VGSYVQSNLNTSEVVEYETNLHWVVLVSFSTLLTGGILAIPKLIEIFTSEFAITNKRIIIKVGFISRRTLEMNLQKIESINVNQSVLGRILGYGTIVVIGSGGTKERFANISNPLEFRNQYQKQLT
jgi:uncharacterized membrane protein YdbT with pleckstrin-like domain